jgi:hypothetical protein
LIILILRNPGGDFLNSWNKNLVSAGQIQVLVATDERKAEDAIPIAVEANNLILFPRRRARSWIVSYQETANTVGPKSDSSDLNPTRHEDY